MNKRAYPTLVLLGPHTTCNYRCVFCENCNMKHKTNSLDKFLTPDIQKLIENATTVDISGYGEIISNPDFKKIVGLMNNYNRKFSMSTNGALLTKDVVDFLADSSLSLLNVSLNSLNPETYTYLSGGNGQLDKVLENLEYLWSIKRKFSVCVSLVITDQTMYEFETFVNYAHKHKIEHLRFSPLTTTIENYPEKIVIKDEAKYKTLLKEAQKLAETLELRLQSPNLDKLPRNVVDKSTCQAPANMVCIDHNNDVIPCCWLGYGEHKLVMGNLDNQSFDEIWNSEKYTEFRSSVNTHGGKKYCQHCGEFNN